PSHCDFACSRVSVGACERACEFGGLPPGPIYIAPGGRYTTSWSGQHFGMVTLPERCKPQECADEITCGRWQNARRGEYEVRATFARALQYCPECTCTPNADGWCQIAAGRELEIPVTVKSTLTWPGG